MATTLVLTLKTDHSSPSDLIGDASTDHQSLTDILEHLHAIHSGSENGELTAQADDTEGPAAASNTITCVSVSVDDTVTIGGVTFTAKAAEDTANQEFDQSGTDTATATSLKDNINAHSTLSEAVVATSSSNVVTVTARQKGRIGNFIELSETGTTITIGGSGSALEGGTGGATTAGSTYSFGL